MAIASIGREKIHTEEFIQNEANALLEWIKQEDNIFIATFAASRDYSRQRYEEWRKSSQYFSDCYARAKEIQEAKLLHGGILGKYKEQMTKFCLVNHHDYKEKSEQNVKSEGTLTIESIKYSTPRLIEADHSEISVEAKE